MFDCFKGIISSSKSDDQTIPQVLFIFLLVNNYNGQSEIETNVFLGWLIRCPPPN